MVRAAIVVGLTVFPLQANGLCLTKSYLRDWSEEVTDRINYLLCLHDEQQQDIAALSGELIQARRDLMLATEEIGQLRAEVANLESRVDE